MESPRLLFVHAHPDDETLTTGATIAHYASRGAQVRVVTCTLGEEGEVIGERWAQLAVDRADQLGGFRIGELSAALNALGIDEPLFLGGAGRWRDSGMKGTPPRHRQRFIDADAREAVGALVGIIRELRPHVVVTYDQRRATDTRTTSTRTDVTTAAVARPAVRTTRASRGRCRSSTGPCRPAARWRQAFANSPRWSCLRAGRCCPRSSSSSASTTSKIDAVVAAPRVRPRSPPSVHATQVSVEPTGRACALSNFVALPVAVTEYYVLAAGAAGERDHRGWETDLLAGLNLG
jgi:N-acetyl-1-D-myo-inositol-2-amino-2-deoxy-alpha-D-glucopyranoside deacetylase